MPVIPKGGVIVTAQPFAHALLMDYRHVRCEHCLKALSPHNRIECDTCHFVSFCSEKCKNNGSAFHCVECHVLAQNRPIRNLTRLICRVLIRLYEHHSMIDSCSGSVPDWNRLDEPSELIWGHKRDWARLMDHYEDIIRDADAMRIFGFILEELELVFDGSSEMALSTSQVDCPLPAGGSIVRWPLSRLASVECLLRMYGRILVNSFAIPDSATDNGTDRLHSLQQIARGVYLGPSIFDHDCRPDAMFIFDGLELNMIALRDLNTDDINTIRICYIDELETKDERNKQLKDAFYFECGCERCTTNDHCDIVHNEENNDRKRQLQRLCDRIEDFYSQTKSEFNLSNLGQSNEIRSIFQCPSKLCNLNLQKLHIDNEDTNEQSRILLNDIKNTKINFNGELNESRLNIVKLSEFVACYEPNIRIMERLIQFYRSYYGDVHPRFLQKLNQFVGVLVQQIVQLYRDGKKNHFGMLEQQLTLCGRFIKQANYIRDIYRDSIRNHEQLDNDHKTLTTNLKEYSSVLPCLNVKPSRLSSSPRSIYSSYSPVSSSYSRTLSPPYSPSFYSPSPSSSSSSSPKFFSSSYNSSLFFPSSSISTTISTLPKTCCGSYRNMLNIDRKFVTRRSRQR